jgi:hypothetical protein
MGIEGIRDVRIFVFGVWERTNLGFHGLIKENWWQ